MPFDSTQKTLDIPDDTAISELLTDARNLIKRGWCQRKQHQQTKRGNHKYCMIGSVIQAADPSSDTPFPMKEPEVRKKINRAIERLSNEICLGAYNPSYMLVHYNDNASRKKQDVLAVYDKAIARLRR